MRPEETAFIETAISLDGILKNGVWGWCRRLYPPAPTPNYEVSIENSDFHPGDSQRAGILIFL